MNVVTSVSTSPHAGGWPDLEELRAMPAQELPALARRIRVFQIERVCAPVGHLGPTLGGGSPRRVVRVRASADPGQHVERARDFLCAEMGSTGIPSEVFSPNFTHHTQWS
jgi:1-deoxy-D-xylulose-5-phosphate synthase